MEQHELRQTVIDFLNDHRKAVFAILDKDGLPTTSLMLYVIDDGLNVFFGTCRCFAKYQHLQDNPMVSLSVTEEALDPLKVVDMRGEVHELSPEDTRNVHEFFKAKNPSRYYIEDAEDFTMFKLEPHFVRWHNAESGDLVTVDLVV